MIDSDVDSDEDDDEPTKNNENVNTTNSVQNAKRHKINIHRYGQCKARQSEIDQIVKELSPSNLFMLLLIPRANQYGDVNATENTQNGTKEPVKRRNINGVESNKKLRTELVSRTYTTTNSSRLIRR